MRRKCSVRKVCKESLREPVATLFRRPKLPEYCRDTTTCSLGATRVGPLLARLRLHLATDRFLAERRSDAVWEAACDYSAMVLARMETRLSRDGLAQPLPRANATRPPKRAPMKPRDAFAICHEIYAVARELVDERLPTTQLQSTSKFLWRPDLHPRLVEYVADFAMAGERALTPTPGKRSAQKPLRASRMILFRMHYPGGLEYEAARRMLGISEITWADWVDEIRDRVGRELMRAGMFPPGRYFREMSPARTGAGKKSHVS